MENNQIKYKLVKRKPFNKTNNNKQNQESNPIINIPELITSIKRGLYSDIDARAKYWMEQRIGLLLNNNALMKKNTTELKIDYDNNSGGLSWLFKYNGSTVAYIDSRGYLYCSNILLNGVNLLNAINNIISINNDLNNLGDIFVRHVDLKNGKYEMNIKDIKTTTATISSLLSALNIEATNETLTGTLTTNRIDSTAGNDLNHYVKNVNFYNTNLSNLSSMLITFGVSTSSGTHGNLEFYNAGVVMSRYVGLCLAGYPAIRCYYNKIDLLQDVNASKLTLSNTLTSNNATITNELTVNGISYFNNTVKINKSLEEGTTSDYIQYTANYSDGIDLAFNYVGAGNSNNAFIVKYHSYGYALAISRYNTILYTGTLTQYANTTNTIYTMGKDSNNCFNITNTINYSDNPVVFTLTRNNTAIDQMKFDKNNGTIILTDLTFKGIKFNDVKTSSSSETDKINDTTIPTSSAVKKMVGNNIYEKGNNTSFLHLNLSGNDSITYMFYSDKYGYFIAFSRSVSVYYSTDAITWQNVSMNLPGLTDFYAVSVVYNNYSGYFFVCDAMSNAIYYSRDGINNWQAYDFGTGHGYGQIAIKDDESGAHWMITGGIGSSDFWYNPTGQPTDWHQFTINIASPPIIRGCVYNSFVKKFALSGQNKAYICDNLTLDNLTTATWTETTFTGFAGDVMRTTEKGIFLCSASSTDSSYYCLGSPYQGNWYNSYQLDNGGGSCQIFDMCYGNDLFWFITSTNNVYYSSSIYNNGNASKMVSPTDKLNRCCYGNGKMIATTINTTDYGIKYIYNNVYTNPITILQMAYPIGSIYTSMNDINPALLFGFGTWQALENYFLYSVPTATATGTTGGEATHTLQIAECPYKNFKFKAADYRNSNSGSINMSISNIENTPAASSSDYYIMKWYNFFYGGDANHQTTPHNNMPPYITIHAWQRIA